MITNLIYFLIACLGIILSGIYLVKSLEKIAKHLGISRFTAAFIIMAVATSLPELIVGITSAIQKNSSLSMGNVIGANIINLTLITGIFIVLGRGIKFKSKKNENNVYFMLFSIALLFALYLVGNELSRIDGIILLAFFIINTTRLLIKRKKYRAKINGTRLERKEGVYNSFFFIFLVAVLIFSSRYLVKYGSLLAIDLNVPQILIGLFLISIATTLPELVFGINAVLANRKEMSIGDQTGTIFSNTCLILGIVSIINPIKVAFLPFIISMSFLLFAGILFTIFMKIDNEFTIKEGIALILIYLVFISIELVSNFPRV